MRLGRTARRPYACYGGKARYQTSRTALVATAKPPPPAWTAR